MIDITHAQAHRLIRTALDQSLPEEQWNVLQAHIERCDQCRLYQAKWVDVERQLHRTLNAHWGEVRNDLAWKDISMQVIITQKNRLHRQKRVLKSIFILLALIFTAGFIINHQINARKQALVPVTANLPSATPSLTPTPAGPPFQGVIAFDAPRSSGSNNNQPGAKDIFLLAAGPRGTELTNLTDNPSRNTDPAWSQDGRWIAFLSNRNYQKPGGNNQLNDIYMMSVAGTRLTRLTHSTDIIWHGPLSWSMDGQWIAASGTRPGTNSTTNYLYLISVAGSQPPRLLSEGGNYPKFSPTNPWLAFLAPGDAGLELYVYDYNSGTEFSITGTGSWPVVSQGDDALYIGKNEDPTTSFDWMDDGKTLSYVSQHLVSTSSGLTPIIEVREAVDLPLDFSNVHYVLYGRSDPLSLHLSIQASFTSPIHDVTWSSFGDLLYVPGNIQKNSPALCNKVIRAWRDPGTEAPTLELPELCLSGSIQHSNWVLENGLGERGEWLVVTAHRVNETIPGIFALHIPQPEEGDRMVSAVRLANLPAGSGPLQVRPEVK